MRMSKYGYDLSTVNGRLKAARLEAGLSQEETAKLVGLSKGGISQMEQGKRQVSKRHVRMMALMLRINERWIWTGEGEKLMNFNQHLQIQLQEQWRLSEDEAKLVVNFVSAPADQRKAILDALAMLTTGQPSSVNE